MFESVYKNEECIKIEKVKDLNIQNYDYNKIKVIEFSTMFACHGMGFKTTPNELKEKVIIDFIKNFKNVEVIKFPSDMYEIPNGAFKDFKKLCKIDLPINIKTIGANAFQKCNLEEVNLSLLKSLCKIGCDAFKDNKDLGKLMIRSDKLNVVDGGQLIDAFEGCQKLKNVIVTKTDSDIIPENVFRSLISVETLILPNNIKYIKQMAFGGMINLKNVNLPAALYGIGPFAFYNCFNLQSIQLPNRLKYIGDCAFRTCTGLKEIKLPSSVAEIGAEAFADCQNLKIVVPKDAAVNKDSFARCQKVKFVDAKSIENDNLITNEM